MRERNLLFQFKEEYLAGFGIHPDVGVGDPGQSRVLGGLGFGQSLHLLQRIAGGGQGVAVYSVDGHMVFDIALAQLAVGALTDMTRWIPSSRLRSSQSL